MLGHVMLIPIICLVAALSCGIKVGNPEGTADEDNTQNNNKEAKISFSITDAPIDEASNVFVTISSLELKPLDSDDWLTFELKDAVELDLLALRGGKAEDLWRDQPIPTGSYDNLRLILPADNVGRIVFPSSSSEDVDGSSEEPLKIPSGSRSGLKIKHEFSIVAGDSLRFIIDFDLRKSIVKQGSSSDPKGYLLKPVLRVVNADAAEFITIDSHGANGDILCAYHEGDDIDSADTCENAITSAVVEDNLAVLGFLPSGAYRIVLYAEGEAVKDLGIYQTEQGR